jgi:hypothetical protein
VLLICPVTVGGGKPALPLGVRLDLELLDTRRFAGGVVAVRHAVVRHPDPSPTGDSTRHAGSMLAS